MKVLIESWQRHPLAKSKMVELMPTYILKILARDKASTTMRDLEGVGRPTEQVWSHMQREGLFAPLVLTVQVKDGVCYLALESGSTVVNCADADGVTFLPVATLVMPEHYRCPFYTKVFDASDLIKYADLISCEHPYQIRLQEYLHIEALKMNRFKWRDSLGVD
ncbi:hypothetical protein [Vibrio mediterranei]|uniref:hypothetical protein n=1 Tax=Vibrio mediterranei TaxID=689 RepID=UPI0040677D87